EVEKGIDRLGIRLRIGIVHLLADGDPPVARLHREPDIEPDGYRHDREILPAVSNRQNDRRQQELEDRRNRIQDREADNDLDALGAAVDDARKPARTSLPVKPQRQCMKMHEGAVSKLPDRILADACKERIAQLIETELGDA